MVKAAKKIYVQTDGSCIGQGMPYARAGWGYHVTGAISFQDHGHVPGKQDVNRAEAYAMLQALKALSKHIESVDEIYIKTDSEDTVNGFTNYRVRIHNSDIWDEIREVLLIVSPKLRKIEHINRDKNSKADVLAFQAASALLFLDEEGNNKSFGQAQ